MGGPHVTGFLLRQKQACELDLAFHDVTLMRIFINALSARLGGGQTYLFNLLEYLPEEVNDEIFVLAPPSFKLPSGRANIKRVHIKWPTENPFLRAAWEKFCMPGLLRELSADVLFCPGGIIGARAPHGCRTVTMFRNMIPFDPVQRSRYRPGYMRIRNWLLEKILLQSMIAADLVIFISEFAKQVIEKRAPGLIKHSVVIPHGISPQFRVAGMTDLPRPDWLPRQNYLLYVSTLDVYKSQIEVVCGFALLKQSRKTSEKLVLAGPENPDYGRKVRAEVARLQLQNDVIVAGPVPYHELPSVYGHALINIFASQSENCPNILLEALAAGRPVLSSDFPPMPEFGGNAVVYFDPGSPRDLAEKLASVIDNQEYMKMLSDKARERAAIYDWKNSAIATWNAIIGLRL